MTATALLLVIVPLVLVAYGLYTTWVLKGDGYGSRRQPPASHYRDHFDPTMGPTRLA